MPVSQLVPHLPTGYLRWKQLRDQPLLTGVPFHVLTLLLDQKNAAAQQWTQERVANRLGLKMHTIKRAFATLKRWGYWLPVRRVVGRARVLHWWGVTDESGNFGDLEKVVARDLAAALDGASSQVTSKVDLQPVYDNPELPCSSLRVGEARTPYIPDVDNPHPQPVDDTASAARRRVRRARCGPRPRDVAALADLPPSLAPHVVSALTLAHDIGVPTPMRRQVAGYLAVCLSAGQDAVALAHRLTSRMTGVDSVPRVIRYRARLDAQQVAPQLTSAMEAALGVLRRA
jgi:hypothetical protein